MHSDVRSVNSLPALHFKEIEFRCILVLHTYNQLTLFLLGVVVLLVNMHSVIYGVRQQLKGVHHLNVSSLLLPNQGSDYCTPEKKAEETPSHFKTITLCSRETKLTDH